MLLILEGADGVGKTTIARRLLQAVPGSVHLSRSRPPTDDPDVEAVLAALRAYIMSDASRRLGPEHSIRLAAAQYALLADIAGRASHVGQLVVADSWFAKSVARFVAEAVILGQVSGLDGGGRALFRWGVALFPPPEGALTFMVQTSTTLRRGWHEAAADPSKLFYASDGTSSMSGDDYEVISSLCQELLLEHAAASGWEVLTNRGDAPDALVGHIRRRLVAEGA